MSAWWRRLFRLEKPEEYYELLRSPNGDLVGEYDSWEAAGQALLDEVFAPPGSDIGCEDAVKKVQTSGLFVARRSRANSAEPFALGVVPLLVSAAIRLTVEPEE